ncbi:hypothetical protein IQ235_14305 [Oscillatoriales cyanobacterium LEGE 11467]|uniref:Uncharacterized protein n=1 Tax=Zarconia navalis LEGE 11467 TaxID=1828826 RepID=A0A928VXD0_9CYAN|nr:hypothetical protein [Zarconia navalis LEGE 11467]
MNNHRVLSLEQQLKLRVDREEIGHKSQEQAQRDLFVLVQHIDI